MGLVGIRMSEVPRPDSVIGPGSVHPIPNDPDLHLSVV